MGLDGVELVLRFEDAFGISIPDEVAASMRTPRAVEEYVLTQLEMQRSDVCLTQRSFHFVRRALVTYAGIPRQNISPGSQLEALLPRDNRRAEWARLGSVLDVENWPGLGRPGWMVSTAIWASLGLSFLFYVLGREYANFTWWQALPAAVVGGVVVLILAAVLTRPFRYAVAPGFTSVGGIAQKLAAVRPDQLAEGGAEGWTRERVRLVIREIIVEEIGVDDFEVDSDFVYDIGIS